MGRPTQVTGLCLATLLVAAAPGSAVAQVDLTGDYTVGIGGMITLPFGTCTANAVQSGTSLTLAFTCIGGNYLNASGTIDPVTGDFSVSGLCDVQAPPPGTPASFSATGTSALDSSEFVMTATCQGLAGIYTASRCGNGVLDATEECEDGNRDDGDCCSSSCTAEVGTVCSDPSSQCFVSLCNSSGVCEADAGFEGAGTVCDTDGDYCTEDTCDGAGTCVSSGQSVVCGGCEVCDSAVGCVADWPKLTSHPDDPGECYRSNRESATLLNRADPSKKDKFVFRWKRGPAFPATEFGTPNVSTDYQLCIFGGDSRDDNEVLAEVNIPAGGGWSPSSGGFRHDADVPGVGSVKIQLKAHETAVKSKIKVKMRGTGIGYVPSIEDVVGDWGGVVLRADNGTCWGSEMGVKKSSGANPSGERFKFDRCYPNFSSCR